jgi:hypothetical protein
MAVKVAFEYFVTFGRAFPSFHLRRGKVGVRKDRRLQVGNNI